MGLNNIQGSKQKVLNRPMFAKMKDGTIKPVQYAQLGVFIQGGKYALPVLNRFGKYIVGKHGTMPYKESASRALTTIKNTLPAVINKVKGVPAVINKKITTPPNAAGIKETVVKGGLPVPYGAFNPGAFVSPIKSTLATGASLLGYKTLSDAIGAKDSEEVIEEKETITSSDRQPGIKEANEKGLKKDKPEPDANKIEKEIKKGTLDDLIKERIDIFEKYLGDGKDATRSGGFAALTEFGLNLASARGGNFMDKIARSAKDPLKTFTAIGMAAKDRADKIKMAGVEAGIKADEAQKERDAASDPEGTTFQQNLSTLTAMFTGADGQLTIDQEDLVNMAKAGGTTSRKEFLSTVVPSLVTKPDINTGETYTVEKATEIAEAVWAQISGQGAPESSPESQSTGTTVVEEESIDTILNKYN